MQNLSYFYKLFSAKTAVFLSTPFFKQSALFALYAPVLSVLFGKNLSGGLKNLLILAVFHVVEKGLYTGFDIYLS